MGDLERALKSTREELLAVHDKTSAKVAKIATENAENEKCQNNFTFERGL